MAKSVDHKSQIHDMQSGDCPTTDQIYAMLGDSLSPAECAVVEEHLSTCENCRSQLELEFGVPQWWPVAKESLSEGLQNDSSKREEDTHQADWRQQLGPTDDPKMLGRIGNYEVVGMVGRGGMGVVFKAFDGALNRYVAIKMLAPHLAASGSARKRFARESQAAAAVVDDNVLPIYGVDQWQGVPYFVMQYSRGITLQKRIQDQGQLELKEILRIGTQTAKGLAAAHAQGLVHRDVKPSNILLDGSVERVLLSDFGLARAVDDASLTRTGVIAGTPQYMSPEQVRGGTVDARCDLFSLGCVLYALCTGRPPFRAENSYAILRQITDHEPPPIRQLNPEIPEWLEAIIATLMAKSPNDRFESAAEVAKLLEQCLAHVQQPLHSPFPVQVNSLIVGANKPNTLSRSARIGVAIATAVLIAVVVIARLFFGAAAPNVAGKWHDEVWGEITLTPSTPGEYDGSFGGLDGKTKGIIRLRWSRKEGRFNGTWSDGGSQTGRISLRPTDGEIRGALTTVPGEGSTPADPKDKAWDITPPNPKSVPGSGPLVESEPNNNWFATKRPRLGDFVWTKHKPSAQGHHGVLDKTDSDFTGQWRCIRAEKRGVSVSPKELSTNALTLSIGENTFTLKSERNEAAIACEYSLASVTSDSTYPHHIDLESRDPIGAHTSIQGIIQLCDGLLHFAHGKGRPSSFKTSTDPDLDQRAYVFERIASSGTTDPQVSQLVKSIKTAEWIRITKAETHVNYVFVDLEWEAAILPYHTRTIFLGPDSPPTEADAVIAREQNRSGVRCSSTNPVSAIYNQGSGKRGTHRLFFRMPDKATAEAALAQIKVKQIDSSNFTLPPLHSHELFSIFRVEHDGKWYQAGVDILPGRGETGKELLGLLYSFPRNMDLTAWKRLDSVIQPDHKLVSVRWEPTSESAPSAKVLRLDASASPELQKRVLLLAQQRIALLRDELAGHSVQAYPTHPAVMARATEIVPDSWFRRDPYKELSKSPENPVGHIRIGLELAAWEPAQSELELSAEQRNRIAALNLMSLPSDPFGTVSETTATAREKVSAILNPEQKARLDQLVWQRLAYEGFETPKMQELLTLSKEQKQGIRQAFVDHKQRTLLYDATLAELRQSGKADATQLATAANDRAVLGIASLKKAWDAVYLLLTEEQRQKYEKLRGPLIKSVQQPSGSSSEPTGVDTKSVAQAISRESLQQQLEQEKAKFPLYDSVLASKSSVSDKLMRAERALFDDREAFNEVNPPQAKEFQQWQRDYRSLLRAKEIIPALIKQAEHRPLMLWAADLLFKAQVPGSAQPTLAKLRDALPKDPSEEQLLQFLCNSFLSDIAQYEGALERSTIMPSEEQQAHCREAEALRALEDIQTMYIDAAHSRTQIHALKKKIEEAGGPPDETGEKPVTVKDLRVEEARLRNLVPKANEQSAVLSRELVGTWVLYASVATDGTVDNLMVSGPAIHFDNDSGWLLRGAREDRHPFKFVVDARKSPASIDLRFAEGIDALGLIELKDGTLSLRLSDVGEGRPASFTSKESAARVMKYRRLEAHKFREPIGAGGQSAQPKPVDIPANGTHPNSEIPMLKKLPYLNELFRNPPRFKAHIACFNGMVDSRSSCSTSNFQPDGKLHATGKMTCGKPEHVSEIEWSFIERRGNNDVYRFTRRFPSDTAAVSTTTKDVEFSDGRVVVFEDEFQVIVIEPPKK